MRLNNPRSNSPNAVARNFAISRDLLFGLGVGPRIILSIRMSFLPAINPLQARCGGEVGRESSISARSANVSYPSGDSATQWVTGKRRKTPRPAPRLLLRTRAHFRRNGEYLGVFGRCLFGPIVFGSLCARCFPDARSHAVNGAVS